jgi:hypothetical protein
VEGGNRNVQVLARMGMMRVHPALSDDERALQEKVYAAAQKALAKARAQKGTSSGFERIDAGMTPSKA